MKRFLMYLMNMIKTTRGADQPLFLTHTPGSFPVGSVYDGYRITILGRVRPTALGVSGVAPCWQVYGIKMPNAELTGAPEGASS